MEEQEKPRANTPLIMLTMFNLLAAVAGSAPFAISSLITSGDAAGNTDTKLLFSVPAVAIVLTVIAWLYDMNGKPKAARRIAMIPLIWGMVVLFLSLSARV